MIPRSLSLAQRQNTDRHSQAAGDNFIGRALDNNDVYNVRDKRGYFRDEIRFSDLGWYASWQRGRGRCNDIYSPKALIKKEERPQQQEEERRQRLKDEKPQQQKKDSQKDLHVQLESQISSCSSGDPPPPYAP